MKCPMCNGSGKCYEQKIRYQEIETNRTDFTLAKCHKCNGTGEVEMTNEEWFCQLSTEEKAKWLSHNSKFMYGCGRMETTPKIMYEEDWEWWLKEKHQ